MTTPADGLVAFFESLTPHSLERLGAFYAEDARFKDPFNDVRGVDAIRRILAHMFIQLDAPRFIVTGCFESRAEWVLVWTMRWDAGGAEGCIEGVSHLSLDEDGRVIEHRDYWDPAETLYDRVPVLGGLLRCIKRRIASP